MGGRAPFAGDLRQAVGVRGVLGADHQEHVHPRGDRLHGVLTVLGGVADVLARRAFDPGEPVAQDLQDLVGLVDRQRGLREVGEVARVRDLHGPGLRRALDQDGALRGLPCGADDLLVPGVSDEHDRPTIRGEPPGLDVDLRHERAGCVDHLEVANPRVRVDLGRHAVGGENDDRSLGNLGLLLHEHGALGLQVADDVQVVDDLLAHVDGSAVLGERPLHGVDGSIDAGAVSAGGSQEHLSGHAPMVAGPPPSVPIRHVRVVTCGQVRVVRS